MIGYHFTADTLRDGRPLPAVGEWIEHEGPLEMCRSGLHATISPFDALAYAPGFLLHKVELGGEILKDLNKLCAQRRRILATIDAKPLVVELARWCAERARNSAVWARACAEIAADRAREIKHSASPAPWMAASAADRAVEAKNFASQDYDEELVAQRAEFRRLVDAAFADAANRQV